MKKSVFTILALVPALAMIVSLGSCTKSDTDVDPLGENFGAMMFWTNHATNSGAIKVHISSMVGFFNNGSVTQHYPSNTKTTPPACESAGCFTNSYNGLGTYIYTWTAIDSVSPSQVKRWSGSFEINDGNKDHCNTVLLLY